jgi:hypothetical protein
MMDLLSNIFRVDRLLKLNVMSIVVIVVIAAAVFACVMWCVGIYRAWKRR